MARPSKTELFQAYFMASKVDFEKLGPIQSSHISADAHCHAEFEYVLAFDENHLARPIVKDYGAKFSILGSFSTDIRRRRRTNFSHLLGVYQPPSPIISIASFLHTVVLRLRRAYPSALEKNLKNRKKEPCTQANFAFQNPPFASLRLLISMADIFSNCSTKIASWQELSKLNYPKLILWLPKVDFEKLGPI